MKLKSSLFLAATLVATAASASPQLFHPDASQSFYVTGGVSQNLLLTDTNGNAVTLNTQGQLILAGLNVATVQPNDVAALSATNVKVDYDTKVKESFIQLSSNKSPSAAQENVRFYVPARVAMDGNMLITGLSSLTSTADQSKQNIAVNLAMTPGNHTSVDNQGPHSCSETRSYDANHCRDRAAIEPTALMSPRFPAQQGDDKGGRGNQGGGDKQGGPAGQGGPGGQGGDANHPPACVPNIVTVVHNGTQTCEFVGDTWTDTYSLTLGSAAQYQFTQDYDTTQPINCSPCQFSN